MSKDEQILGGLIVLIVLSPFWIEILKFITSYPLVGITVLVAFVIIIKILNVRDS